MANKTGQTLDISSLTNSAVMAVDAVFRKNGVPVAHRHEEIQALLHTIVASVVADHIAESARAKLDTVLDATNEKEVA
jgi:hypothetical protein